MSEFIHSSGWGGGKRLFEFDWEEEGVGAYSRLGVINFFCLWVGRLFEVGANSRLSAYSNKYGMAKLNCTTGNISGLEFRNDTSLNNRRN